ncbi:hypothetical protein NFI96_033647, partial [Prochilodus magdalenae]
CPIPLSLFLFLSLDLLDNEDVKVMHQGSSMLKIRSPTWQKKRTLRLLENCETVSCESNKRFSKSKSSGTFSFHTQSKDMLPVSVKDVECVLEGSRSDMLPSHLPEKQLLTILFKSGRKSLNLLCHTMEEAQHWARGLRTLQHRVNNMNQTEKLDQYPSVALVLTNFVCLKPYVSVSLTIYSHNKSQRAPFIHFNEYKADANNDGQMSYEEVQKLLQMINIDMDKDHSLNLFKKCDASGNGGLEYDEIRVFCHELLRRSELHSVFHDYAKDCVMSTKDLQKFLIEQGEDNRLLHAQDLIVTYELNEWAQKNQMMTVNGFTMYMLSKENEVFRTEHSLVYQDMSQPLSHYFISSSHNTYLIKDQLVSESSTDPYIRALMHGCRCVELDCWDGDNEPIIHHGHTLTSKVPFREVVESIAEYAFKSTPYPLILSLEVHCSVAQQTIMAQQLCSILGDKLLTKPLNDQLSETLPSPEASSKYNKVLSFHTFPSDAENRHKWIVAIRRENFTVTTHTRVCSRHFKKEDVREPESKPGRRLLKKGAVRMLFEGNNFPVPLSKPGVCERRKRPTEDDIPVKEADTLPGDHDYASASAPDPATVDLVLEENTLLREELKGKILVKGKKARVEQESGTSTESSNSQDEPQEEESSRREGRRGTRASSPLAAKLSPELSDLVVYTRSVPFKSFEQAAKNPSNEMTSFSERVALKHINKSGKLFVRHNSQRLSRIYPSGQRLQSSNYNPQDMWNVGCQLVALNFQTDGKEMDLNRGRFLPNGCCGYVLKPSFLCQPDSEFNPKSVEGRPGHNPTLLTIKVISAQQLPKPNTEKLKAIVDPQVRVEIHGVPKDNEKKKTHRIDNNGFNPKWNCTFEFLLHVPELALVRFVVEDHDRTSKNDFLGQFTLPFTSMCTGPDLLINRQ